MEGRLWSSGVYQPAPRLAASDLVSCFPPLSTTRALSELFLERVNPHAWLISEGETMSVVDELEKDPSRVRVWGLCSLLLALMVATHYQAPTATVQIHADIRWENTVFLYLDEVLAKAAQNPLWAIRVFVLLTINGMGTRKNSCWNYHGELHDIRRMLITIILSFLVTHNILGIAVSLAESYCPDLSQEGAESESSIGWHRIVRTLYTLDTWVSILH